jgi:hypothetical protein
VDTRSVLFAWQHNIRPPNGAEQPVKPSGAVALRTSTCRRPQVAYACSGRCFSCKCYCYGDKDCKIKLYATSKCAFSNDDLSSFSAGDSLFSLKATHHAGDIFSNRYWRSEIDRLTRASIMAWRASRCLGDKNKSRENGVCEY